MAWCALSPRNENGKCCINLRKEGMKDRSHHREGAVERGLALHAWETWPGRIAEMLQTRGAQGGCMQNRRMQWACPVSAMKTRPPCAIDPSRLILENLPSALPSPAHPFPCLGEGLHNLDLPWPQDVRAAETEDTCRRQGHCCGFVAPNRQQLLAYVSQDIPSQ